MTREVINKMPEKVMDVINMYRKDYANPTIRKDVTREGLAGYVKGLRDAGLITERERQILFVYGTVPLFDKAV